MAKQEPVAVANPWLIQAAAEVRQCLEAKSPLARGKAGTTTFDVRHAGRSLWAIGRWRSGARVAFCLANVLNGESELIEKTTGQTCRFRLHCGIGEYSVEVGFASDRLPVLRWKTTLRTTQRLAVPYWPRDILPVSAEGEPAETKGTIHTSQRGPKGNIVFATMAEPGAGSFLYLQNLGTLSKYFDETRASAADRIGGVWPEIGFSLPPAPAENPLAAERDYVVADVCLAPAEIVPEDEVAAARLFLDLYADAYQAMDKPPALYRNWPRRVGETLQDLTHSPKCSVEINGNLYLRAYAGSDDRPVESMVQLAVLVPLIEYAQSREESVPLIGLLSENVATFFDRDVASIVRWLPDQAGMLKGQEEHMKPNLVDSWYLWHTLLNLARLAQLGHAKGRELFLKSLEHGIHVAQRFNYRWPVFYDMKTLAVIKPETRPGKGGEHDVGALYAHVMLKAYELTDDRRYIDEAVKAAWQLQGLGFELAYQFNNVSFGAGALYRLWQETGEELFKGLSDVCWANLISNLWLWDADYGHAKYYSTFMGLPPLTDAKYIAVYEELEVLAAIHEYLRVAGDDVPTALRLLLPEYCKYVTDRAWYHYPSELPADLLAEKQQSGEVVRYLSVPLEDLYDGWEQPGQVGQEVYGAAAPFIISTRHCHRVPGESFNIHVNYPVTEFTTKRSRGGGVVTLTLGGDPRCRCEVRVVPDAADPLPEFRLSVREKGHWRAKSGQLEALGYLEWQTAGNAQVRIEWARPVKRPSVNGVHRVGRKRRAAKS